jgi:hypothetical protein
MFQDRFDRPRSANGASGKITWPALYATRDIAPGEELLAYFGDGYTAEVAARSAAEAKVSDGIRGELRGGTLFDVGDYTGLSKALINSQALATAEVRPESARTRTGMHLGCCSTIKEIRKKLIIFVFMLPFKLHIKLYTNTSRLSYELPYCNSIQTDSVLTCRSISKSRK